MGIKKKKATAKAVKKAVAIKVEEQKLMPARAGLVYKANMDNIIFEASFKDGSQKDELGKYVPAHLREASKSLILSVGPIVNNPTMKKGANIVPVGTGKITILEVDEAGYVGSIKPHDILAIVK